MFQCQDTMVQFGSYLFQVVTIEELNDRLPSIGSLLSDYHINADVAFFLARPLFINMLNVSLAYQWLFCKAESFMCVYVFIWSSRLGDVMNLKTGIGMNILIVTTFNIIRCLKWAHAHFSWKMDSCSKHWQFWNLLQYFVFVIMICSSQCWF